MRDTTILLCERSSEQKQNITIGPACKRFASVLNLDCPAFNGSFTVIKDNRNQGGKGIVAWMSAIVEDVHFAPGPVDHMGIHPTSLFAIKPEILVETRQDIWQWAEPVILDCAAACYDRAMPSRLSSNLLAKKHNRLWHAVIHDQESAIPQVQLDLRRISEKFNLDAGLMEEINGIILEELFDIMLFRYRGSLRSTKASTMILMAASAMLTTSAARPVDA